MAKGTVNKVILLGRVGMDPEVRFMPSGTAVTTVNLATNDGYKDKQTGNFVENTEWHRVTIFGQQAENIVQFVKKGSLLYVEGRIKTNKWQDQSGQDRYSTEIVALNTQFIGGRDANSQSQKNSGVSTPTSNDTARDTSESSVSKKFVKNNHFSDKSSNHLDNDNLAKKPSMDTIDSFDDDIPF